VNEFFTEALYFTMICRRDLRLRRDLNVALRLSDERLCRGREKEKRSNRNAPEAKEALFIYSFIHFICSVSTRKTSKCIKTSNEQDSKA